MINHKLESVLVKLAGAKHVAGCDAQAAGECKPLHAGSGQMTRDEGEQDG